MTTYFQVEGIVIHTREFGEKDALLTLITKERGKLSIICKGVKKPVSRMRSAAQLFTHARFFLYEGKSLATATQAQSLENFKTISTDLTKFAVASYWAELLELVIPEREMNYHAYLLTLKSLRLLDENFTWALFFAFQFKLLTITGYQPVIDQCTACGAELNNEIYLSVSQGGTLCSICAKGSRRVTEGTIQSLRLFKTASLEMITKLKLSSIVHRELKVFLREYIEYHTETRLRSAEFLASIE